MKANPRCPVIALIRLDLPTLLLPRKATSGNPSAGKCSSLLALRLNSAINITTPDAGGLARGLRPLSYRTANRAHHGICHTGLSAPCGGREFPVMNCPKCNKDRAHRVERRSPLDNILNWFFLKPYFCRDCSYRFHSFPGGGDGPTLRMEFDQRFNRWTNRKGWKRALRDLSIYGLAALLIVALLYFMARQSSST